MSDTGDRFRALPGRGAPRLGPLLRGFGLCALAAILPALPAGAAAGAGGATCRDTDGATVTLVGAADPHLAIYTRGREGKAAEELVLADCPKGRALHATPRIAGARTAEAAALLVQALRSDDRETYETLALELNRQGFETVIAATPGASCGCGLAKGAGN